MNKTLNIILLLSVIMLNQISANESTENKWESACSKDDLVKLFNYKRYLHTQTSNQYAQIISIDDDTIEIDKKKKKITAWVIQVLTPKGRSVVLEDAMTYKSKEDYSDVGFSMTQYEINYREKKIREKIMKSYSCTGDMIASYSDNENWIDITPATIGEKIMKRAKFKGLY